MDQFRRAKKLLELQAKQKSTKPDTITRSLVYGPFHQTPGSPRRPKKVNHLLKLRNKN